MSKMQCIILQPTVIDNNHESLFRCNSILDYVLKMIKRGDSKETIIDTVEFLRSYKKESE
jgi:hypothetical protein